MRCPSAKGSKILGYKNPPPGPGAAGILSPIYPRERLGPEGDNPGTSVPSCPAQSGVSIWGLPRFEKLASFLRPQLAPGVLETTGLGF